MAAAAAGRSVDFLRVLFHVFFLQLVLRSCPSGEGIFAFFSERARHIVDSLHEAAKNQSATTATAARAKSGVRPLFHFLRHSTRGRNPGADSTAVGSGRKPRKPLAKSTSVMANLTPEQRRGETLKSSTETIKDDPNDQDDDDDENDEGGFEEVVKEQKPVSTHNNNNNSCKKSASESDLLSAKLDEINNMCSNDDTDGFYRSYDDIDDIDLSVLADSNTLEAAVVLRAQPGQYGLLAAEARCSFNSSDSGRMSDSLADASTSSVASSSNANTSDSGAHCNSSSISSEGKGGKKESETTTSPNLPPFNKELYGNCISIADPSLPHLSGFEQDHRLKDHHNSNHVDDDDGPAPPPPPLRFATVRKSLTLPHNLSQNCQRTVVEDTNSSPIYAVIGGSRRGGRRRDLSSHVDPAYLANGESSTPEFGFKLHHHHQTLPLKTSQVEGNTRSRPKSLGFASSQDQGQLEADTTRSKLSSNFRAMNKALSRISMTSTIHSAPTTPDSSALDSPRRKNLVKFLGLPPQPNPPRFPLPPPPSGILKKSNLSSSTPMDLENYSSDVGDDIYGMATCQVTNAATAQRWQSNDGLATPGSLQGGCSPFVLTPSGSPSIQTTGRLRHQHPLPPPTPDSCGPKQSNSMFSLACTHQDVLSGRRGLVGSLQRNQRPLKPPPPQPPRRVGSLPRSVTSDDLKTRASATSPVVWVAKSMQMRRNSHHQHQQGCHVTTATAFDRNSILRSSSLTRRTSLQVSQTMPKHQRHFPDNKSGSAHHHPHPRQCLCQGLDRGCDSDFRQIVHTTALVHSTADEAMPMVNPGEIEEDI